MKQVTLASVRFERYAGTTRRVAFPAEMQRFSLSDAAVGEALYESISMRHVAGIDLVREPVPDETTVCRFRHLLEEHGLGRRLFEVESISRRFRSRTDNIVPRPPRLPGRPSPLPALLAPAVKGQRGGCRSYLGFRLKM